MKLRYGLVPGAVSLNYYCYILVKIYAVMSHEFKNLLNVPCLLGDLEGKVKWLDNFQKFRHLQEIIVWPPLWDRDKRFFIPEVQKRIIKTHVWPSVGSTLVFTKSPAVHLDIKSSFMSKNYSFLPHGIVRGEAGIITPFLGGPSEGCAHSFPFQCPSPNVSKCLELYRQSALPKLPEPVLFQPLTTSLLLSLLFCKCLKHIFKEHMAENILSPTNRHLLYEGKLTLAGK